MFLGDTLKDLALAYRSLVAQRRRRRRRPAPGRDATACEVRFHLMYIGFATVPVPRTIDMKGAGVLQTASEAYWTIKNTIILTKAELGVGADLRPNFVD